MCKLRIQSKNHVLGNIKSGIKHFAQMVNISSSLSNIKFSWYIDHPQIHVGVVTNKNKKLIDSNTKQCKLIKFDIMNTRFDILLVVLFCFEWIIFYIRLNNKLDKKINKLINRIDWCHLVSPPRIITAHLGVANEQIKLNMS